MSLATTTAAPHAPRHRATPMPSPMPLHASTAPRPCRCAVRGECIVELAAAPRRPSQRAGSATKSIGDRTLPAVFVAGGISAHRHVACQPSLPGGGLVGGARSAPAARSIRASTASSPSTGSAPTARSMRRSIRPTRPMRSPRCSTRSASHACRPSSAVPTARWSACSSRRATGATAAAGRDQRRPSRASVCQRLARAAASGRRAGRAAMRRNPRPRAGAAAGDPELSHARGIRRALRRRPGQSTAACASAPRTTSITAARKYVERTSPTAYLRLSESIDLQSRRSRARSACR